VSMFKLSTKSLKRLEGVDKRLQDVVKLAITLTDVDFTVIEGMRTLEKQKEYLAKGVTKTLKSEHLVGRAVDLYPWVNNATSHEAEHYADLAKAMFAAATQLNVQIEWGGEWKSFIDKPHWQLKKGT
jgi:peptidoglycan L-alanyl-D-glutamate endopeptidase CwlK